MWDPVSVYVAVDGSERKSKSQKEKQEEFGEGWITGGRRCRDPQEGNISFSTLIASPPPLSPPHTIKMIFT